MGTVATTVMATFDDVELAAANMEVIRALDDQDLEIIDAAVIRKNADGHVEVLRDHRHPVGKGVAVGAVVGLLAPVSLVAGLLGGAAVGDAVRHVHKGVSRDDLRALGEFLDAGDVMLVVVAKGAGIGRVRAALRGARESIDATMTTDEANLRHLMGEEQHVGLTD
jgi:uncharacterized membrane protein